MTTDRKIKPKKVFLASDHAGFKLKEKIKKFLIKKRNKVLDLGTNNTKYHNAFNGGEENRIHLVACVLNHKFN